MRAIGVVGVVALGLFPAVALADPISFIHESRYTTVSASVRDAGGQDHQSDVAQQADDLQLRASAGTARSSAVAWASLVSSLADPTHLWGSGVAGESFDTQERANTTVGATYDVGLHLDRPYSFAFTSRFRTTGDHQVGTGIPGAVPYWNLALTRRNGPSPIYLFSNDTMTVTRAGTLSAGDWFLFVNGGGLGVTSRQAMRSSLVQFDFTMDLTPAVPQPSPTPEPASMLLLGSGIAGAFAARRRR